MAVRMTATDAVQISPGMWAFSMPPHQVMHFGRTTHAVGVQSVVIFDDYEYDALQNHLNFDIEAVTPVNIGTTSRVIGIAAVSSSTRPESDGVELEPPMFGPGDLEFLKLTKQELSAEMGTAAEKLLTEIRSKSPGNLKRGQSRNFSETPDNFWYVIVQPRIDQLSITVRGTVSHFEEVAGVEIKDDRGNTRFKVQSENDVTAALKLIFHAVRKS